MLDYISGSLTAGWLPHGYCLSWNPALLTALVSSDSLIALSYFSIPIALGYFYRLQKRSEFGELILLFVLFIAACGLTHLLAVVNVWRPMYLLTAVAKAGTALVSVVTAVALWPLVPRVSAFIDQNRQRAEDLERLNRRLQEAMRERDEKSRELEASEARFRLTFDSAPIGLALAGADWRIDSLNQALASMLGYQPAELSGYSLLDLVAAAERDSVRRQLQAVQDGAVSASRCESQLVTRDGDAIDVAIDGVLQRGRTDSYLLVQVRDVTVSKQLAELRERTAAELRDLYDQAPCGYHSLDGQGRYVRINDTELRWLGYSRDEVIGRLKFQDLLDADGRRAFEREYPRFIRDGEVKDLEFDLHTRHGQTISVMLSATAVYDDDGRFRMSRSTIYDITEQRAALRALRDSENYLQQLLRNMPVSVVVHKADTSIEYANPAAEEFLQLSHEQLIGKQAIDPTWHFCREDMSVMPVEEFPVAKVLESRQALSEYVVGVVAANNGERPRWAYVHAFPEIDADGELQRVIVSFFDISALRELEARLRELATTDELTGIANRRAFREQARRAIHRARRSEKPLVLLLFDIDHFKPINDQYGHDVGDKVIKHVADIASQQVRDIDELGRWGGEEYVVLLPDTDRARGLEVAERVRQAVEGAPLTVDGASIGCRISVGVADSDDAELDLEDLVRRADVAMYAAKADGRNRVVGYSDELEDRSADGPPQLS